MGRAKKGQLKDVPVNELLDLPSFVNHIPGSGHGDPGENQVERLGDCVGMHIICLHSVERVYE